MIAEYEGLSPVIRHCNTIVMKRVALLFFLVTIISSCKRVPNDKERVIFDRIQYIYSLKKIVNENVWKGFTDPQYAVPLIYYTDSACYVANPTAKFLNIFKPVLVFTKDQLKIYKNKLLDSIPFHMATWITFGDSTAAYNYKSPFMSCSSVEITKRTIPGVNSTEQWATMIIHECVHGFQYKHPPYLNRVMNIIGKLPEDTLEEIYKSHKWFKESIDKENDMLLSAIKSANKMETRKFIDTFFLLREQRRLRTIKELHFDIEPVEKVYETMEGTARYVGYSLYKGFATLRPDDKLVKHDHLFQIIYFIHINILGITR